MRWGEESVAEWGSLLLFGGITGRANANLFHDLPTLWIRVVGLFSRSPFFLELVIRAWVVLVVDARLIHFRPGVGTWSGFNNKVGAWNSWTYHLKTELTSIHSGLVGLALGARLV